MEPIQRIHHVSATVADANATLRFYRDILGLRLVKKTVNFEDNGTYHLYFANKQADVGTIITFFPLEKKIKGRVGAGQVRRIVFSVPKGSLQEWMIYLNDSAIDFKEDYSFQAPALFLTDSDGLSLALVETDVIKEDKDILGFFGIELLSEKPDETLNLLRHDMGLTLLDVDKNYYHLEMAGAEKHRILIHREMTARGRLGIGTVHHIAWSVPNKESLENTKEYFDNKVKVTDIKDRKYFQSAYFRDPGHIIYEMATEGPGFTVDEPFEKLGSQLMLPEHYESKRDEIEARLPKLNE